MSWVRNNVSKAISQQRAFYAGAAQYQPTFQPERTLQRQPEPQKRPEQQKQPESQQINKIVQNLTLEPNSCMKYIDAILYINLEHRKDRLDHIKKEIRKIHPDMSKAQRIDAIKDDIGVLGCVLSHIKALQLFISNPSWNTCMILEDDFTFTSNNSFEIHKNISYMFNKIQDFDVILLGTGVANYNDEPSEYPLIKRVLSSQTTSGYIISRKYIFTLLANFIKGSKLMKKEGWKEEYCLDIYWKQLMPFGKWYTFQNRIGYQYGSHSDIENKFCDYNC